MGNSLLLINFDDSSETMGVNFARGESRGSFHGLAVVSGVIICGFCAGKRHKCGPSVGARDG